MMACRQIVKPRARVRHVEQWPWNPRGLYYEVHGLGFRVGCASLDIALAMWHEAVQNAQLM